MWGRGVLSIDENRQAFIGICGQAVKVAQISINTFFKHIRSTNYLIKHFPYSLIY